MPKYCRNSEHPADICTRSYSIVIIPFRVEVGVDAHKPAQKLQELEVRREADNRSLSDKAISARNLRLLQAPRLLADPNTMPPALPRLSSESSMRSFSGLGFGSRHGNIQQVWEHVAISLSITAWARSIPVTRPCAEAGASPRRGRSSRRTSTPAALGLEPGHRCLAQKGFNSKAVGRDILWNQHPRRSKNGCR